MFLQRLNFNLQPKNIFAHDTADISEKTSQLP